MDGQMQVDGPQHVVIAARGLLEAVENHRCVLRYRAWLQHLGSTGLVSFGLHVIRQMNLERTMRWSVTCANCTDSLLRVRLWGLWPLRTVRLSKNAFQFGVLLLQ